jgi:hypothetical protein
MSAADRAHWDAEQGQKRLPPEDAQFAYGHAVRFAAPADGPDERAFAYAAWFDATYIRNAETLEDLPSHRTAWDRFLGQQEARSS